jgi:hypothetical protein
LLAEVWLRPFDRPRFRQRAAALPGQSDERESHDAVQDAGAVVVFRAFGDIAQPFVERDHVELRLDRGLGEADLARVGQDMDHQVAPQSGAPM